MKLRSSQAFTVKRHEPELIVPAKPRPREVKQLSDIDDQEGFRFQIPFIFFYKNNLSKDSDDPIRVIKVALGRALAHYYPLAGRLREGSNRKLSVDCSGEGVLFLEATADTTLEKLGDTIQQPSLILEDVLYNVPGSDGIVGCPLLLIQVTRLLCGGFILAIRMNHAITDAFGLVGFLKTVAEMARGTKTPSVPPVWEREILNAQEPPLIAFEHHEYEEAFDPNKISDLQNKPNNDLVQRSFFFGTDFVKTLRNRLPKHVADRCSQHDLLTAVFWKCRTLALKLGPQVPVQISSAVSFRGKFVPNLPPGFYGNASAFPAAISSAELLRQKPLSYAVELIMVAKAMMSREYIRSVADYMVTRGRPSHKMSADNVLVSDTRLVGFGEVDFGWGPPSYAGPASARLDLSTFARCKNAQGKEGTVLNVCLPSWAVNSFELELNAFDHIKSML